MHFRSRSLSQKSDIYEQPSKRNQWQPNPEVKAYMKKQELCRKQKVIYENLHKFAEESRRRSQLQKLEGIGKPIISKKKTKKPKKKMPKKKKIKNIEPEHETEEEIHEDTQELNKSLSFVYDSDRNDNEPSLQVDLRVPELSKIKDSLKEPSSISEIHSEKNITSNSNYEENEYNHNLNEEDIENDEESKIEEEESFSSVDNQVKNIINKWSKQETSSNNEMAEKESKFSKFYKESEKKFNKPLVIDIPSSESDRKISVFSENESKSIITSEGQVSLREAHEKKIEYQERLKEQLIWREAQMHSLEYLRQKEIKDMQTIAQKVGKSEELSELLSNVVEKRYDQLSALFEENLKNVQDILISDMNAEEREKFEETLEEKREEFSRLIENDSKTMEEYIDDIMSRNNNLAQSESSAENRPVIYKPKSGLSLVSYEESEMQAANEHNPQSNSFFSPTQKDFTIQESIINRVYSDDEPQESLNILGDIQGSPSSSYSSKEMQNIQILTQSPEKSSRFKILKLDTPPSNSPNLIEPTPVEEISLDVSSSIIVQDSSLLEQLQPEFQGPSYTPDYIPERPSAPLQYFDNDRESPNINTSPVIPNSRENDMNPEENSDAEWISLAINDITPELVVKLSEEILMALIYDEHKLIQQKKEIPQLPIIDMFSIDPAVEGSSTTELRIQTDIIAIRNYLEEIFSNSDIKEVQKNISVPLRAKPLELLNRMQEVEIGTILETEYASFPEILSVNLYLNLENNRENSTRPANSLHIHQLIIEAEHIHNKMIFDAANEALQKYRPYGLQGIPMPWSFTCRFDKKNNKPIKLILEEVKEELLDWSTIQAGKISTEDMMLSNGILDEELLQQVREDRLANMLAEEIIERDNIWINYEFEETQVKLDIADMILEELSGEIIKILG